jgi:hypothetical protein
MDCDAGLSYRFGFGLLLFALEERWEQLSEFFQTANCDFRRWGYWHL